MKHNRKNSNFSYGQSIDTCSLPISDFNELLKGLNSRLKLSELAYHKFLVGITKNTISNYSGNNNFDFSTPPNISKTSNIRLKTKLFLQIVFLLIKFSIASIVIHLLYKNVEFFDKHFLFITMQKEPQLENHFLNYNYKSITGLIPTINALHNKQLLKNTGILNTFKINLNIIKAIKSYFLSHGVKTNTQLSKYFSHNDIYKFNDIIIKGIIYKDWAKILTKDIKDRNSSIVVVTENDSGGPFLFLVDRLKTNYIKTVHVQHGTYNSINPEFIPPLSEYFVCSSERELYIQMNSGMKRSNLFLAGLPIQVLKDTRIDLCNDPTDFDVLILGGNGTKHLQMEFKNILTPSLKHISSLNILFRHHPNNSNYEIKLYENIVKNYNNCSISNNRSLREDILRSDIIFSFSIDALIPCIIHKKKTLFYVNSHEAKYNSYKFLDKILIVRPVRNLDEFQIAVSDFRSISKIDFEKLYDHKRITQCFGESDIDKIKMNFTAALNKIYIR